MRKLYALGIIVLLVWLIIQFPHLMLNPGELTSGHQELNNKCMECHDPFRGITSDKCISCHKPEEIGKDSAGDSTFIAFHAKLTSLECISCHTDHKGLHPTRGMAGFDHTMLSVSDREKCTSCHSAQTDRLHMQLSGNCGSCHNTDSWSGTITFDHSKIEGEGRNNCTSCHDKPADAYHGSVTGNCSECHGTNQWVPSTFDHSAYFVFDKHHQTTCATCHTNNDYTNYTCYGCHEHSEANIREEHQEEGISNFSDCASCHHSGDEEDAEYRGGSDRESNGNEADQIQQYLDNKENHDKKDDDD